MLNIKFTTAKKKYILNRIFFVKILFNLYDFIGFMIYKDFEE